MVETVERCGVRYVQGHSKIYQPAIRAMGEIVANGRLGRVIQINTWNYNAWMRSPRRDAAALDPKRGGGVVFRQGPHQMDTVRYLGGGLVRSVRGVTGRWYPYFDVEGNYSAFLDFESGAGALLSFNAYGYFNGAELTWGRGEGGQRIPDAELYGPRRTPTAPVPTEEFYRMAQFSMEALEHQVRQQDDDQPDGFFGITLVSCERGDIRQSERGLYVYTDRGREEASYPLGVTFRGAELQELKASIEGNRPVFPGAGWGRATLEACLAIMESSRERREVYLQYQTPSAIRAATPASPG